MTHGEAFIEKLAKLGNGERAALKRSVGVMLSEADAKALAAFYRCHPPVKDEDCWFAVACLCCFWDAKTDHEEPIEKVFAQLLEKEKISKSMLHRMEMLLDTEWDDDGFMLIKLTRLIQVMRQKSDGVNIDFAALGRDLCEWKKKDSNKVQRRWAREIYRVDTEK